MLIVNGVIVILCFFIFEPVTEGDASAYIGYAKQIFGFKDAPAGYLLHKSPLYSILLGLVMLVAGEEMLAQVIHLLQNLMVILVSLAVFRTFCLVAGKTIIGFLAGVLSTLNLSTVYFAYNILSETLALLLFSWAVYCIVRFLDNNKLKTLCFGGILTGLLVLARFNTIGLPFLVIVVLIIINVITIKEGLLWRVTRQAAVFSLSSAMILSVWSLYNLKTSGFFGVIPPGHKGQRWAIPAIIDENTAVPEQYSGLLDIFLNAKAGLDSKPDEPVFRKGTLLTSSLAGKALEYFKPANNGFFLYNSALPDLLEYFGLPDTPSDRAKLHDALKPFYGEVAKQGREKLFKLRVFSLLYTFKHVSPVSDSSVNMNLNILPAWIIISYKLLFIFVTLITYAASFIHLLIFVFRPHLTKPALLAIYGMIWYFPLSNFYANVLTDANRFRYPAESIILGVFAAMCFFLIQRSGRMTKPSGNRA